MQAQAIMAEAMAIIQPIHLGYGNIKLSVKSSQNWANNTSFLLESGTKAELS